MAYITLVRGFHELQTDSLMVFDLDNILAIISRRMYVQAVGILKVMGTCTKNKKSEFYLIYLI